MVRSAYFFGVTGILLSAKNCAPLSAVASKASAGTLEVIAVYDSSNLAATLERTAEQGFQVRIEAVRAYARRLPHEVAEMRVRKCVNGFVHRDPSRCAQVLGADAGSEALACGQVRADQPTVLVMGSEGYGLRTNVKRACTSLVKIPAGLGLDTQVLDSLNVSVATGVLLHTLTSDEREGNARQAEAGGERKEEALAGV